MHVYTAASPLGSRTTIIRPVLLVMALFGTSACQSHALRTSGFLTSYQDMAASGQPVKQKLRQRRDDIRSDAIRSVYIAPAVLTPALETRLSEEEQNMVRHEVDRQICFEVSERFAIAPAPSPDAATIRTAIVQLRSSDRVGSAAAAAVDFVNPVPIVKFRLPGTSGGLAVESEMLDTDGTQIAALLWRRDIGMVTRASPSMSRAGDALQISEPLGDAVGKAFATKARPKIKIGKPDPCERHGPRKNMKRTVAGGLVGSFTGLYVPQIAGTGGADNKKNDRPVVPPPAPTNPPKPENRLD